MKLWHHTFAWRDFCAPRKILLTRGRAAAMFMWLARDGVHIAHVARSLQNTRKRANRTFVNEHKIKFGVGFIFLFIKMLDSILYDVLL